MDSFKSKTMFAMLLICALALPLIIGASFAIYTVDDTKTTSNEKVQLTTTNLDVNFIANEYITNSGGKLIKPEEVKDRADFSLFTIKSSEDTTNTAKYSIAITNIETTYDESTNSYPLMSEDFKWRLARIDGKEEKFVQEGTFSNVETDRLEITDGIELSLEPGEEVTYKLYIWLQEADKPQNDLLNKTFKSRVSITSVVY